MRIVLAMVATLIGWALHAQTTILYQGFETPVPCGSWAYTGGNVNFEMARTGTYSARVGRNGQTHTIAFNTVNVAGLAGLQLSMWHSVRPGSGPGMDVREGAVVQVALDGGAWITIGQVGGTADHNYTWASPVGGYVGTSCTDYTMPNPLVYNVPGGTNTLAFRVLSAAESLPSTSCPNFVTSMTTPVAGNYDRPDEGFFIDDVTLTTTSAAPYPFIWTGAVDTDWHKCTNWNFGVVPTATSNVTIDQTAVNNCEVYTAVASCASLALSSNNANAWGLTVRAAQSLTVGGAVTVTRTGPSVTPVGITLGDATTNGSLQATSLTLLGTGAGAKNAFFRNERPLSLMRINGPVTIQSGGHLDLEGGATGGVLQITGNYSNNDDEAAFDERFSLVTFWGVAAQSINTTGFQERFGAIRMAKQTNGLTLNAPISLRTATALQFAGAAPIGGPFPGGRIFSTSTNLLSLESTVTATSGATDNSHVDGPVQKFGPSNFIYPIGKNSRWRPVQLRSILGLATDAFLAEYFPISAYTWGSNMEPTLHHISDCEYWSITRSAGSANAQVYLSYHNTYSCGVTLTADLRVAKWDDVTVPNIWRDRGNNGVTTTAWGGYVPTTAVESEFGIWTLASSSFENPLPIELLEFTAQVEDRSVVCKWSTASEHNNDFFSVERSADGVVFQPIGRVEGAGDSWTMRSYDFVDDEPLTGVSYYRLRQFDLDGSNEVSQAVAVKFSNGQVPITVIAAQDGVLVLHDMPSGSTYTVHDAVGRILRTGSLSDPSSPTRLTGLPSGTFLITLTDGVRRESIRFVCPGVW